MLERIIEDDQVCCWNILVSALTCLLGRQKLFRMCKEITAEHSLTAYCYRHFREFPLYLQRLVTEVTCGTVFDHLLEASCPAFVAS